MMKRERRGEKWEWEHKRRYSDQRSCKRKDCYFSCSVSQGATLVEGGSEEGAKKEGDEEEGGTAEDQAEEGAKKEGDEEEGGTAEEGAKKEGDEEEGGTVEEGAKKEGDEEEGGTVEDQAEEGAKKEGGGEEGGTVEDQAEEGAKRDEVEEEEEERVISYDYEEMKSKPEIVSLTTGSMLELQYPACVTVLPSTLLFSSPLSLSLPPPPSPPPIHPFLLLFLTSTSYSFGFECQKRSNLVVLAKEVVAYAAGNLLVLLNLNTQEQTYRRTLSGGGIGAIAVSV